jgi:tetratricopeptide (TPR) repeat protein
MMFRKLINVLGYCLLLAGLLWAPLAAQDVQVWEEDVVLPTYRLDPADKNPMFYKKEVYQGAQKRIYPYPFQEHVTNIREDQAHRFVFLENDYVKLSILPEIGGRLFSAVDKTNDYDIFYRQHVIKPALIGMLGAWISGGIEWCVFHHHRNTTQMPVDYTLVENSDGSKTIWFGETERRHRMKWLIGITLFPGKSYIEATVKMFNRTPLPNSILYWANVAVHVNDDYQVVFPPSVQYATYHSKNNFIHWPVGAETYQRTDYRDVDVSWWKNHPEPISMFAWDLQEDFMGGYDHGREAGVAHVGNHHIVAGAKLWEWSPGPRGRMWDKILTDADGPYAELMVGAFSDNQPDYSWIKPYEVKTFKQYWYPIREIGGFKAANLEAAVNLNLEGSVAHFGFNATSALSDAKAVLRMGDKVLVEEVVDISPEKPYLNRHPVPDNTEETLLQAALYDSDGNLLVSYQPVEREYDPDLPKTVVPPGDPVKVETIEELYLTGLRVQQINSPSVDPNDYFSEALRRDPNDARTNTIVGMNLMRRGLYQEAEQHLRRAVKRLSEEYTRPSTTEANYNLGLVLRAQGNLDEAYKQLYRATWDNAFHSAAYFELAGISCLRGDFEIALDQISKSLTTNTLNTKARNLKAAILRKLGLPKKATHILQAVVEQDPLDFLARNELALLRTGEQQGDALAELKALMRDDVQSYIELATDYGRVGMWDEAVGVLRRPIESQDSSIAQYPMLHYFLGYYYKESDDSEKAAKHFTLAGKAPADYAFPFRLELMKVFQAAIDSSPSDARTYYYMGNLLYEIQPEQAIKAWQRSAELDPSFGLTHRNLGWAYYRHRQDISQAIPQYERAVLSNPDDPRLFSELDQLYEIGNVQPEKRLALLEKNHEVVVSRNYSFLRAIMANVLVGNYDKAVDYLSSNFFHVREGGGEIHDVFVDAHLLRGLDLLGQGKNAEALQDFKRAAEYPENLSVGIPRRDPRTPQVAFFTAEAYAASGDQDSARQFYQKTVESRVAWQPEARFYRALALQKLGDSDEAGTILGQLISQGEGHLTSASEVDFFAKFGERQSAQARKALGHYLIGLGYLGKGQKKQAKSAFEKSVELNVSNVWAKHQLERLQD